MNIERERGKCKYPLLFQPLKVNKIVLKNRIISAPLGSNTDKSLSGIGMIIRGTSGSVDDTRMRLTPGTYCFANLSAISSIIFSSIARTSVPSFLTKDTGPMA